MKRMRPRSIVADHIWLLKQINRHNSKNENPLEMSKTCKTKIPNSYKILDRKQIFNTKN